MDKTPTPPVAFRLGAAEWEVLYLLYDALDQLRKLTLSYSELRYLAVEHTEQQISAAVAALLQPQGNSRPALVVQIPNLANIPIYRITPVGRDMVKRQKGGV